MKTLVLAVAALSLFAHEAMAVDVDGKWGLGAGIFNSSVGEMTLIRGRSARSAWLFDISVRKDGMDLEGPNTGLPPVPTQERNTWFVSGGPGFRSYTRPDADLSPYWDLVLFALFQRQEFGQGTSELTIESLGGGARFDLGVEYFTPWKFSLAAHTTLVRATWSSLEYRVEDTSGSAESTGDQHELDFGIRTGLAARIYF